MALSQFKNQVSNVLLALGVIMLLLVGILEFAGAGSDPLLPAVAALAIGMTAVLDRLGAYSQE